MELKDVKYILKKIQSNYSSFIVDTFTTQEWYRELKDYELDDILEKLDKHFRSEEYGNQIPKVYFLTKYCRKTEDKKKYSNSKIRIVCQLCNETIELKNYDQHYSRCSSVNYVINQTKKYYDKELDRESLMNMSEKEFNLRYNKLLKAIQKSTEDPSEEARIAQILNSKPEEHVQIDLGGVYENI